jgi:hypothetical protein
MKIATFILLLLSLTVSTFAQQKTNIEILDSLCNLMPLYLHHEFADVNELKLDFNKHPHAWYPEQKIVNSGKFTIKESDSIPRLSILLSDFGVKYRRLNADSLIREIHLDYEAVLYKDGIAIPHPGKKLAYIDSISEKDLGILQDSAFPFSKSEVPEKDKTWLDDALEPIIVVGSAALTVLLFFTVRSN